MRFIRQIGTALSLVAVVLGLSQAAGAVRAESHGTVAAASTLTTAAEGEIDWP